MNGNAVIIGCGMAGLSAALHLARQNECTIHLVSDMMSERSQSCLAEGGINAAIGPGDSPELHFEETLETGCGLADADALMAMASAAPDIIRELDEWGVPFVKRANHSVSVRRMGGQTCARTAYTANGIGRQIMDVLIQQARRYEAEGRILCYTNWTFRALAKHDGRVCGAWLGHLDTQEMRFIPGQVIMACGGLNGFFGNATGSTANTGIAAALLFADGVPFSNLEFIQFHPTTLRLKGKNLLISESARSEGGRLFVLQGGKPYYFMEDKYPELGNLMPRDIVSREECLLIKQGAQVYLDLRGLPEKTYETTLADIVSDCILFAGIDPEKEPIPVEPGIHYFMGGIQVDRFHRSPVKGLYAAGECACQYHGANRLGGNSLLGAIHGGKTAAEAVLCSEFSIPDGFSEEKPPVPLRYFRMEPLQAIMRAGMGLERSKAQLENALNAVEKVSVPDEIRLFSRAILLSAWNRTESRGSHFRSDYPECNPAMRKSSVVQFCDGEIRFSWETKP